MRLITTKYDTSEDFLALIFNLGQEARQTKLPVFFSHSTLFTWCVSIKLNIIFTIIFFDVISFFIFVVWGMGWRNKCNLCKNGTPPPMTPTLTSLVSDHMRRQESMYWVKNVGDKGFRQTITIISITKGGT